jgi:ribosomal subunit interface protein
MKFDHSFKHQDVSQALMTYVEEKMLQKLAKYEIKPGKAHVTYGHQRHECHIEVHLMGGEHDFKAHANESDWYASVDQMITRLESQMKKRKSKVKAHRHPGLSKQGKLALVTPELEMDYKRLEQTTNHKKVI